MKAYQYDNAVAGLEAKDIPIPEPKPGYALIAVKAAGLCRSDVHIIKGHLDKAVPQAPSVQSRLGTKWQVL